MGGPGDGGFDLILVMNDTPALIQVKQRLDPAKAEAVSSIREFIGALALAGSRIGFYVSSATHFSRASIDAANRASGAVVDRLELVDATRLIDILKLVAHKAEPWRMYAHARDQAVQDFRNDTIFKFISAQ